jgi:hypothetical protein
MAKFEVAPKKTISGQGHEQFGPGTPVTAEILGCTKAGFESLIKDGTVIDPAAGRKSQEPKEPAPDPDPDKK